MKDTDIQRALMHQVYRAQQCLPSQENERNVTTLITRAMWKIWLRACGRPETDEPTDWLGIEETRRVYGSRTIVIESEALWSVSYPQT